MHAFLQALHFKNFNYCCNYLNLLGFLVPVKPENHNCTECKVFDEKGNPTQSWKYAQIRLQHNIET